MCWDVPGTCRPVSVLRLAGPARRRCLAARPVSRDDSRRSSRMMHYDESMLATRPYLAVVRQVFRDDSRPSSRPSSAPGRSAPPPPLCPHSVAAAIVLSAPPAAGRRQLCVRAGQTRASCVCARAWGGLGGGGWGSGRTTPVQHGPGEGTPGRVTPTRSGFGEATTPTRGPGTPTRSSPRVNPSPRIPVRRPRRHRLTAHSLSRSLSLPPSLPPSISLPLSRSLSPPSLSIPLPLPLPLPLSRALSLLVSPPSPLSLPAHLLSFDCRPGSRLSRAAHACLEHTRGLNSCGSRLTRAAHACLEPTRGLNSCGSRLSRAVS